MIRKRRISRPERTAREIAREAVDLSKEILNYTRESTKNWADFAKRQNETTEKAIRVSERAMCALGITLDIIDESRVAQIAIYEDKRALPAEFIEVAADLFPRWSVSTGMANGEAKKTFVRRLDDMSSEHLQPSEFTGVPIMKRDAYLNFCDSEYFDRNLLEIFGSWNGSGDTGSWPHLSITASEAGPITYHDIYCVSKAEEYLVKTGYVTGKNESSLPDTMTING